jgi:hypothetical protein
VAAFDPALRFQVVLFDFARDVPDPGVLNAAQGEPVRAFGEPKVGVQSAASRAAVPDRLEALIALEFHGHVAAAAPGHDAPERSAWDAAQDFAAQKAVVQAK